MIGLLVFIMFLKNKDFNLKVKIINLKIMAGMYRLRKEDDFGVCQSFNSRAIISKA